MTFIANRFFIFLTLNLIKRFDCFEVRLTYHQETINSLDFSL
jgi:hypothetical protein